MKRIKPFLYLAFSLIILLSLISCTPVVSSSVSSIPAEISLPENNRIKGAAWVADDILAYYAEDGVHIWNAESGEGPVLTVSSSFSTDKSVGFALSPDKNKLCVTIITGWGKRNYDVFDVKSGELLKHLDLADDFKELTGVWAYGYTIGFFNNNTLYAYNIFGMWFVDINTGEQQRISANSMDFYENCDETGQDYFEWVYTPVLVDGKLYYSGIRNKQWQSKIYCADQNGETELNIEGDTGMLAAISGRGFVYMVSDENDDRQIWYYDIKTTATNFVGRTNSLGLILQNEKIGYATGSIVDENFTATLYDINTMQTQSFTIYSTERDFPNMAYCQLEQLFGFVADGDGYAFLFRAGLKKTSQSVIVEEYLIYSTETDKAVIAADYSDYWLTETTVSPSGEFILITNHNLNQNGYPFKVVKTSEYIHPASGE